MEVKGKTALVTGGGSGIGRAICETLAKAGANIVVVDINAEGAHETLKLINKRTRGIFVRCDVASITDIEKMYQQTVNEFGSLDIICLNAGIQEKTPYGFIDTDFEDVRKVIDIDLMAVILGTKIAVQKYLKPGSVIVVTASVAGTVPQPEAPVYSAAKAGVVNFVRSLKWLKEQYGVRINAVCPHFTNTPMIQAFSGESGLTLAKSIAGGVLEPSEIADAALELIEKDKTGEILRVIINRGKEYWPKVRAEYKNIDYKAKL